MLILMTIPITMTISITMNNNDNDDHEKKVYNNDIKLLNIDTKIQYL